LGPIQNKSKSVGSISRDWSIAILLCIVVVVCSVLYIDQPVARFFATFHIYEKVLPNPLFYTPILTASGIVGVVVASILAIAPRRRSELLSAVIVAGAAMVFTFCLTDFVLKPLFARSLPYAYLQHAEYGFHWLDKGSQFVSFPSGHAAQIGSLASVFWIRYPRWRTGYGLVALIVALVMIAGEWHFVSDVIAGGFIGAIVGAAAIHVFAPYVASLRSFERSRYDTF
jgi:membrane-associated phospholipid phosphatase